MNIEIEIDETGTATSFFTTINIEATQNLYAKVVFEAVSASFPGAKVSINRHEGGWGSGVKVNGANNSESAKKVFQIMNSTSVLVLL